MKQQRRTSTDLRGSSIDVLDSKRLLEDYSHEDLSLKKLQRFKTRPDSILLVVVTVLSLLLNAVLATLGLILYHKRGPSNPIFPQALYCENYGSDHLLKLTLNSPSARRLELRSSQVSDLFRAGKIEIPRRPVTGT